MSPGDPLKSSCKTSYPYLSYPRMSEQSVQWLLRTCPDKTLGGFWHAPRGPFESAILYFETLLHSFISMSIISPNFKTIHPVVTKNLSEQNFGGKKKNKRPMGHDLLT